MILCRVCYGEVGETPEMQRHLAAGGTLRSWAREALCWICRRLKASAWAEARMEPLEPDE